MQTATLGVDHGSVPTIHRKLMDPVDETVEFPGIVNTEAHHESIRIPLPTSLCEAYAFRIRHAKLCLGTPGRGRVMFLRLILEIQKGTPSAPNSMSHSASTWMDTTRMSKAMVSCTGQAKKKP